MKNVEIRYRHNPEDRSTRKSNQNVQISGRRTLKITYFERILRTFNHDGHTNVKWIDKTQGQIIATSNEPTHLKHRSLLRRSNRQTSSTDHCYVKRINEPQAQIITTLNESTNLEHSALRPTNRQILKTESPRRLRNWEFISVCTSHSKRKNCIHTQNPLNAQKLYLYAQSD